jgi:hypothetical protein
MLSNDGSGMKSYFKLGVLLCVIALSIGAYAGSIETFNYSTAVSGVSNTTVQGTFNFNTSTDTFTLASLSFVGNSIFGGLSGTIMNPQFGNTFVFNKIIDGYTVSYDIVLNPLNGSYTADGSITTGGTIGTFKYSQVPEGGARLSYLLASGLTLLAGIALAVKPRRRLAAN